MRNTTQDKADRALVDAALATLDRAIRALGLGTVSDKMVTHPTTIERFHKGTRKMSLFMAANVLRVLAEYRS